MGRLRVVFRCVGQALLAKGPKALCSLVPFGEVIYDVAADAWERLSKEVPPEERTSALAIIAAAGIEEARREAEAAVAEMPLAEELPLEQRINLVSYLTQVPCTVRQSLKRPADPTGKTVPPAFTLERAEQLVPLLPVHLPRFKPGDRPAGAGNWELVELLGTGGFGEVWKAKHPSLAGIPPVALKFCLDASAAAVLRHEASLLDRVMQHGQHPGIVSLRQAYLDSDPLCLEYEYVSGGDLAGVISDWHRAGKPPRRHINRLMLRLAQIVGHAHALRPPIVHRDLKPANILVQMGNGEWGMGNSEWGMGNSEWGMGNEKPGQGQGGEKGRSSISSFPIPHSEFPIPNSPFPILKVADFGIGGVAATRSLSVTRQGGDTRTDTLATSLRGAYTPLYASPQQVKGEHADPRDDVHALGVIWYQMLTGDLTSGVPADWATLLKERGQPRPLIDLLGACVTSRSDRRLASAVVLAEQLRTELDGEPILEALPVEPVPEKTPSRKSSTFHSGRAVTRRPSREEPLDVLPIDDPPRRAPEPQRKEPPRRREPERRRERPRRREASRSSNHIRHFEAPGLNLEDMVNHLQRWLQGQDFNVQDLLTEDGATLIQIEQRSTWRKLTGMSSTLNIILDQHGDELTVEIGAGQWMDKAAVGVVSLIVLWPLAVTAAVGAWNQMQLPEQIFLRIEDRLHRPRAAARESAPPAGLSTDAIARLKELAGLRDGGILTEEEFQAEKKRLMAG